MKKKQLLKSILIMTILSTVLMSSFFSTFATTEEYVPEITDYFTIIDENGRAKLISFEEASQNSIHTRMKMALTEEYITNPKSNNYYIAYLNAKSYDGKYSYLKYDNASNPGYDGYTTGAYAKDGAYIGEFNGKYRVMQSGILMDFNKKDVKLIEYSKATISHYYVKSGYIYHQFYYGSGSSYNSYRVGYAPNYMKEGIKYYSYDGHYFYTSYPTLVQDIQSHSHSKSINSSNPHYNYFQYLSHRSQTSITEMQFNTFVNNQVGNSASKMKNTGKDFISNQNIYGVNALLMFGVAGNESGWGTSRIAKDKNNLFGHGAVDSNPYYGANGYKTPADSIKYHAERFISNGYLDAEDWRYNGAHLGDKASGINVRYASDPYWGEKAASIYYYNDTGLKDYDKVKIGLIEGVLKDYKLYKEPSFSSSVIHTIGAGKTPRTYNHPILVLDEIKDKNGTLWYKIQSDTTLNTNRTDLDYDGKYNFTKDYVYIPAQNVKIVNNNSQYMLGDVNNNKKIDAADYLMIMDTILGKYQMTSLQCVAGDVNKNNKIDAADYLMVMDTILGKIKI